MIPYQAFSLDLVCAFAYCSILVSVCQSFWFIRTPCSHISLFTQPHMDRPRPHRRVLFHLLALAVILQLTLAGTFHARDIAQ